MTPVPQPSAPPTTPSIAPPPVSKKMGVISLVFSILGIITIIVPFVGFILGVISLIFAGRYVKHNGLGGMFSFIVVLLAGFATFFGAVTIIVFIVYGGELIQQLGL